MLSVRRLQVVILAVVLLLLVLLVLHPDDTAELLPTALPLLLLGFVSQPLAVEPVPVLTTELPDDELLTEIIDCGRFELFDSGSVPIKELRSFGARMRFESLVKFLPKAQKRG